MAVCNVCTTAINAVCPGITGSDLDDLAITTGAAIKRMDSHTCANNAGCVCICTDFTVTGASATGPAAVDYTAPTVTSASTV